MDEGSQFRIRYWGVTGTLARTMLPGDIAEKFAAAIQHLLATHVLEEMVRTQADLPAIRRHLTTSLPLHLRSSYLGNSTCIEIETADELIVIDCGTGFRDLGYELQRRWNEPGFTGAAGPRADNPSAHRPHHGDSIRGVVL